MSTKSYDDYLNEYDGPTIFSHLHSHSIYSPLDGVATPADYAKACHERGYPGMALTEHGNMASLPELALTFRQYGLKPIAGCEIYYNDYEPIRQDLVKAGIKYKSADWKENNKELRIKIDRNRHLTVLAKNETGISNLIKLITQAYDTGLYGAGQKQYNRIWFEKLAEYSEGLIVLSGCLNGPVSHALRTKFIKNRHDEIIREVPRKERLDEAVKYIKKFRELFGEDYYIELQMPGVEDDILVFKSLVALADHFKIKLVMANDSHYMKRKDFYLQKVMMAVNQETYVDSPDLFHVNSDEQYFKTRAELYARFKTAGYGDGIPDSVFHASCDNTLEIVEKCQPIKVDDNFKIPEIDKDERILGQEVVRSLLDKGKLYDKTKYIIDNREVSYVEQAQIEMQRIVEKGFASYFLITRDLIKHGKDKGWPFMARGSAGGSLVCFLLGIHNTDPMQWGLSFDRFLSPSRGGYLLDVKIPD